MVQNASNGKSQNGAMDINKALETIVRHKAKLMMENDNYTKHIKDLLRVRGISTKNDLVQVFKIGAVDAMIFDVGCALNLRRINKYDKRKKFLGKLFPKQ